MDTLRTILTISGKPGLYKLLSHGRNMLVVEMLDASKKRMPVYSSDKVTSLGDISMYTEDDEVPLADVLALLNEKENGAEVTIDYKKASAEDLKEFFAQILPDFDRDRVYASDIRKLIQWYNLLIKSGIDLSKQEEQTEETPVGSEDKAE